MQILIDMRTKLEGDIDLSRTKIDGYFKVLNDNSGNGISLTNSHVGSFKIDTEKLPNDSNLNLDHFIYDTIDPEDLRDMPKSFSYRKLLNSQYNDKQSAFFSPQPYDQLAKALSSSGREEEATRVLIAKQGDLRKYGKLGLSSKIANIVFAGTIRHGYRPYFALLWSALFIFMGTFFFGCGKKHKLMFPTKANPHVNIQQQKKINGSFNTSDFVPYVDIQQSQELEIPEFDYSEYVNIQQSQESEISKFDYSEFVPLVYSIDSFIPIIDLGQKAYWLPKYNSKGLRFYLWIHVAFGWIFTSLWVAGFTGLVRRSK